MNDLSMDEARTGARPARGERAAWIAHARVARVIARFTVVEVLRGRWAPATLVALGLAAGAMAFAAQLAIVERGAVALAIGAPLLRLACVLLVGVFGVTLVVRELGDRTVDLTLAAPVPRFVWLAGKWAGVATVGVATALLAALPLAWLAEPGSLVVWAASLALENMLVAALAIAVAVSLAQVPIAVLALAAFYALGRLIGVLLLLQERSPALANGIVERGGDMLLQVLAHVMPRLDLFTRTQWLLGGADAPGAGDLGLVVLQSALYIALLAVVGVIDFGRRDV